MELAPALARYAHALGRWQAAWRFASPALRRAVSLAQISAAWDVLRRDAGPGQVGRAHENNTRRTAVTCTDDPRRDCVLLWLVDHGAPAIAEAAALLARMVGASRRFSPEEQELLQAARDTLGDSARPGPLGRLLPPPSDHADDPLAPLRMIAAAVDHLRANPNFFEGGGSEVQHLLPRGRVSHYVPAEPGATWALNFAVLTSGASIVGGPAVPGLVSRALFRTDVDLEEVAAALIEVSTDALAAAYSRLEALRAELDRGDAALSHMSRNSRSRDAWLFATALRAITRTQLRRGFDLSRAGADIQARALAAAGLVRLAPAGRIEWQQQRSAEREPARIEKGPLSEAVAELDATIAAVDRHLARIALRSGPFEMREAILFRDP